MFCPDACPSYIVVSRGCPVRQEKYSRGNLREALLSHDVAAAAADVRLPHRDPGDLLLVATARVLNLTLVTADDNIIDAKQVSTLANR
jgi:PIN domain nuclease of toxin-antitoxin system